MIQILNFRQEKETHPSIMKIKGKPTCFILNKVNVQDAEKLIRNKGAQGL